jgi:Predicted Zn-dependent hydrolases of the beta-lactamase fold
MQIIWHGQSCFELIIAKGKGEHITVLADPLDEAKTGLRFPKTDAQVVLLTNRAYTADDADIKKNAAGAFVVDGPGEYEIKDVYIRGVDSNFGKTKEAMAEAGKDGSVIYTIETEEMKLCHLGNLKEAELTQGQVEKIGNIDILMFPVGDGQKIGAKEALKIVSQIEPSIAIPMNYEIPKLKLDANDLKEFLKAAGVGQVEPLPKLTIKKKEISAEEAKIIVLNP